MFKPKNHISLHITAVIIIISVIYVHTASLLLRSSEDNIIFIKKELHGLDEYKKLSGAYFDLPEEQQKEAVKTFRRNVRSIGDNSNLILDPSQESYYAVSILFDHIPRILHYAALPEKGSDNIEYILENLEYAANILKTDEEIKNSVEKLRNLKPENKSFADEIKSLTEKTTSYLEYLLNQRLKEQKKQYSDSLLIIVILYFSLIFSTVFAIRNYVTRLELKSTREKQILITELAAKNAELEQFTYAAAHDLREPLRTLSCFAGLLKKEQKNNPHETEKEYGDIIERTAKRAEKMIEELLNYAKQTEEKNTPQECNCNTEVKAVLEDLRFSIEETKAKISVEELPILQTSPVIFRRIMLNLIDNAIKYRKKDTPPQIHIEAKKSGDKFLFAVTDNGIGIAEEHRKTIFKPFKRLYPDQAAEGIGLGLTSCKKSVELLGGEIAVKSEQKIGTTVYFGIPATKNYSTVTDFAKLRG